MHPARIALLLLHVACVRAADLAPAPYPTGPLLTVTIPDVPRLRARLVESWYGRLWTAAESAPLRERFDRMLAEVLTCTGIDLARLGRDMQRVEAEARGIGDMSRIRLSLSESATAAFTEVDAAIARATKNPTATGKTSSATTENGETVWLTAMGPQLVQRATDGVVLYRSRPKLGEESPTDGLLFHVDGDVLTLANYPLTDAPALTATPVPTEADLGLDLDLGMLANALGIPGLADFFALAGTAHGVLDLRLNGESSTELVRLAGAHLPLKVVDCAALEAEVPASALSLSAFGIDGPLLATLMTRLAARRPDLGFAMTELAPALRGFDGTAWMAMLAGTPFPDLVLGVPADATVDAWLTQALHASPELMREARSKPVTIPSPTGWHFTLAARRLERSWLLATDAKALVQLGNPGLAKRLATRQGIPAEAVALCVQASEPLLRMLGHYAVLGQLALATEVAAEDVPRTVHTGNQQDPPQRWTRSQLADLRLLASSAFAIGGNATAPPAVGWLLAGDDGIVLHGRNLALGVTTLPMSLTVYLGLLPAVVPEWTARNHAIFGVALAAASMPWADARATDALGSQLYLDAFPGQTAQLRALALASPSPAARRQAAQWLSWSIYNHPQRADEAEALWVAMLSDPRPEPHCGALESLAWHQGDHPPNPRVITAVVKDCAHSDPAVRTAAFHVLHQHAATYRDGQRAPNNARRRFPPSPAALEPLLAACATETYEPARLEICGALSGYDDARVLPTLSALLNDRDPSMRAMAARALCALPGIGNDLATLTAVAALREDQASTAMDGSTVGEAMLQALLLVPGAIATGFIAHELDRPAPGPGATPMQAYLRAQAVLVLVRRGHGPALTAVNGLLAEQPPIGNGRRMGLAKALGACPLPGAIAPLLSLLTTADAKVVQTAADSLLAHAKLQPLDAAAIATLTADCTVEPAATRIAARRVLERVKLDTGQTMACMAVVADAIRRFGDKAFPGYKPPTPEEKPGADDF